MTQPAEEPAAGGRFEVRDGMRIGWQVPIPADDGVVLQADVYLPDSAGTFPAIVSYGPYAKGLSFQEGYAPQWQKMVTEHPDVAEGSSARYQCWEVADPEKWVPLGYACVRVDSRGAGWSPGFIDVWSRREAADLAACIEWAAAQPWCSGKVGLSGISYYAMNQWHVAALRPPHLTAMIPWEGAADFYRDVTHHGGILCDFAANWYERQVKTVQYGLGIRLDPGRSLPYRPYHPHDAEEPLLPGEVVQLDVEIWPACIVVPAGYRLVLSVRGNDYEYQGKLSPFAEKFYYAGRGVGPFTHVTDRPAGRYGGNVTIHTGQAHPSSLLLPVILPAGGQR